MNLRADIMKPGGSTAAFGAGLRDEKRASIAQTHLLQQGVQRSVCMVAHGDRRPAMIPLIVRIIVEPHDIEIVRRATQFRLAGTAEDVEGLKLHLLISVCASDVLLVAKSGFYIDQGLRRDESSSGVDRPYRLDGGDRGPHELALELGAPTMTARLLAAGLAAGPGPERHLVNGAVHGHMAAIFLDQLGCRGGEASEPIDEGGRPYVEIVGIAVVAQIPDDARTDSLRGPQHRQKAAPVVVAGPLLDEMPSQAVSNSPYAMPREKLVVPCRKPVVLRARQEVEPAAVTSPVA
jgi:hypothetical protein